MIQDKKKSAGSREAAKKAPALGLVIALAVAGGVVIGSAGTYYLTRPQGAPQQVAAPLAGETSAAPVITMSPPPQSQFTPAPQPPGEAPPGKVWSPEHGHWHDAPGAPAVPTLTPAPAPVPAPVPVTK